MTNITPDIGPRCGECRLGLGTHRPEDPYCDHHETLTANQRVAEGDI